MLAEEMMSIMCACKYFCSVPGGSDGRCRILGTRRPGEKCFGPATNCKGLYISHDSHKFLRNAFHLTPSPLPLAANDGQKLLRTVAQDAVRFYRLCVRLRVQGKKQLLCRAASPFHFINIQD